ncbi:VOC family protein [Staphylococcus pseudintermedius]|uniref:Ring-cleaving dioxygenase n=1 Tax=Staphylococcus pseudintermedius TaxID=283734 RepID=A0A8H9EP30_STAPS|nr:VOC family protein [Staphylococcus pseudintermedius]ADV06513.1 Glyoxalase family protein [Staphylococcus pseudintermedius HKU10-03]ANQ81002.1 glyoxalase [Staphylococcus pseudintermedius]ANQ87599.1 glyoxalase [Staphylococcus pseudintermedius]ASQ49876.1 glyoxalase [Staphylococcus pseudintermedius]AYG55877.1 ring-cleaving dioxygenase [Staphylococcus pseudintermedius]
MNITGHHHISMYTKDLDQNKAFYTETLGLHLTKETVNQDDHGMVHIFYGDQQNSPGTLLTFFEIPNAGAMRKGTNMIARIGLLVPNEAALDFFEARLQEKATNISRGTYMEQPALYFDDPDTLSYVMMVNGDAVIPNGWQNPVDNDIPAEYQILGLGPIEIHVADAQKTLDYLRDTLDFKDKAQFGEQSVVAIDDQGYYSDLVIIEKDGPNVRPGRGYVHHHALATENDDTLNQLVSLHDHLAGKHSGVIDRIWFKSLYYRQNKIMYEFATLAPGF